MSRRDQQLAAIAAIAEGRYPDASTILEQLRTDPPPTTQSGVCRFCGCSEARACGVVVVPRVDFEPTVIRCAWADDDATVCTNIACLERWRRESPAELDVDVHDVVAAAAARSRLVLP